MVTITTINSDTDNVFNDTDNDAENTATHTHVHTHFSLVGPFILRQASPQRKTFRKCCGNTFTDQRSFLLPNADNAYNYNNNDYNNLNNNTTTISGDLA